MVWLAAFSFYEEALPYGIKLARYQRGFLHQKVMLVDDSAFIGSLNISEPYSGAKYGTGDFRDLNVFLRGHDSKDARDFFRANLMRNVYHK